MDLSIASPGWMASHVGWQDDARRLGLKERKSWPIPQEPLTLCIPTTAWLIGRNKMWWLLVFSWLEYSERTHPKVAKVEKHGQKHQETFWNIPFWNFWPLSHLPYPQNIKKVGANFYFICRCWVKSRNFGAGENIVSWVCWWDELT